MGGPDVKMSHFYKFGLKSISSHSKSFDTHLFLVENWGVPPYLAIFRNFCPNFPNFEGGKGEGGKVGKIFFQKWPKYGLVSEII